MQRWGWLSGVAHSWLRMFVTPKVFVSPLIGMFHFLDLRDWWSTIHELDHEIDTVHVVIPSEVLLRLLSWRWIGPSSGVARLLWWHAQITPKGCWKNKWTNLDGMNWMSRRSLSGRGPAHWPHSGGAPHVSGCSSGRAGGEYSYGVLNDIS